ncbi:VOC family protein [Marinoscillum sp.]|uniref:VOC family protein n=1 Tax=Marinoscillum sp. TaxID=2024838 RepID=UPI003BAC136A
MRSTIALVSIVSALLFSCEPSEKFSIDELTIVTKDAKIMSDWYAASFGFMDSKDYSLLYHDNLTIKLVENPEAKRRDSLKKDYNIRFVPGIHKFGFATNQFDELIDHLKSNGARFHGSVVKDSILNTRMIIVKDPDNNNIQIFESAQPDRLKPNFFCLITENVGEQEKWYQVNFPIEQSHRLDQPENDVYIRLLTGQQVAIELLQVDHTNIMDELDYPNITGFYSMEVKGANVSFEYDHDGNKIFTPPTK